MNKKTISFLKKEMIFKHIKLLLLPIFLTNAPTNNYQAVAPNNSQQTSSAQPNYFSLALKKLYEDFRNDPLNFDSLNQAFLSLSSVPLGEEFGRAWFHQDEIFSTKNFHSDPGNNPHHPFSGAPKEACAPNSQSIQERYYLSPINVRTRLAQSGVYPNDNFGLDYKQVQRAKPSLQNGYYVAPSLGYKLPLSGVETAFIKCVMFTKDLSGENSGNNPEQLSLISEARALFIQNPEDLTRFLKGFSLEAMEIFQSFNQSTSSRGWEFLETLKKNIEILNPADKKDMMKISTQKAIISNIFPWRKTIEDRVQRWGEEKFKSTSERLEAAIMAAVNSPFLIILRNSLKDVTNPDLFKRYEDFAAFVIGFSVKNCPLISAPDPNYDYKGTLEFIESSFQEIMKEVLSA